MILTLDIFTKYLNFSFSILKPDASDRRQPAVDYDQGVDRGDDRIRVRLRNADPDAEKHCSANLHREKSRTGKVSPSKDNLKLQIPD